MLSTNVGGIIIMREVRCKITGLFVLSRLEVENQTYDTSVATSCDSFTPVDWVMAFSVQRS